MFVVGVVEKVTEEHLTLRALGAIKAIIRSGEIKQNFKYKRQQVSWVHREDKDHTLKCGSQVRFAVKTVNEWQAGIELEGSLRDPGLVSCTKAY